MYQYHAENVLLAIPVLLGLAWLWDAIKVTVLYRRCRRSWNRVGEWLAHALLRCIEDDVLGERVYVAGLCTIVLFLSIYVHVNIAAAVCVLPVFTKSALEFTSRAENDESDDDAPELPKPSNNHKRRIERDRRRATQRSMGLRVSATAFHDLHGELPTVGK